MGRRPGFREREAHKDKGGVLNCELRGRSVKALSLDCSSLVTHSYQRNCFGRQRGPWCRRSSMLSIF